MSDDMMAYASALQDLMWRIMDTPQFYDMPHDIQEDAKELLEEEDE